MNPELCNYLGAFGQPDLTDPYAGLHGLEATGKLNPILLKARTPFTGIEPLVNGPRVDGTGFNRQPILPARRREKVAV